MDDLQLGLDKYEIEQMLLDLLKELLEGLKTNWPAIKTNIEVIQGMNNEEAEQAIKNLLDSAVGKYRPLIPIISIVLKDVLREIQQAIIPIARAINDFKTTPEWRESQIQSFRTRASIRKDLLLAYGTMGFTDEQAMHLLTIDIIDKRLLGASVAATAKKARELL